MHEQNGQQIIDAFFTALEMKEQQTCEDLLRSLQEHGPTYRNWHTYLRGILANEFHRDWAEGERLFSSLLRAKLEPAMRGRVLMALGNTYDYQGRWSETIALYEQCLAIFDRPDQAINRAKIWKNMAITLQKGFDRGDLNAGHLHQAVTYCQRALAPLQAIEDPADDELWLEATIWNTLGVVFFNLGDLTHATRCFERRITLGRTLRDVYGIGMASNNLGEVLQSQGSAKQRAALQAYRVAHTIYQQFGDLFEVTDVLANLGSLHHAMGDRPTALDYYRQAIEGIETLRLGISAESARAGFFETIVDIYANAVLLCLEMGQNQAAFEYVERARARAFLDMVAARSSDLPQRVASTTLSLADVQAALPTDALLVEYFTTGLIEARVRATPGQGGHRNRFPAAHTLIFAVTHDDIQVYNAGISPNNLLPHRIQNVVERHFLAPEIRSKLYDRLIGPFAPLLQGKRRLYLIPHGPLHYIPFQALIGPDGGNLLHEAGPALVYAPSASFLFHYGRAEPSQAPRPCLALGYNGEGVNRLLFAEEEARLVARLTGGNWRAGPARKKTQLGKRAADYRLLHFCCHGTFDPASPLDSALHLSLREHLTALHVLNSLRLRCDLVILSACESGLGHVRRGDELVGMIRAFISAGAHAVIASLWPVDDRSTLILMYWLYQRILQGETGIAEALKRAQLDLMKLTRKEARMILADITTAATQTSDQAALEGADDERLFEQPYYWAPFILVGDHGSP